tara:strand:+ start:1406 stop:1870 length:465 start_codon:yes stop_codon:yes gene_type:complete
MITPNDFLRLTQDEVLEKYTLKEMETIMAGFAKEKIKEEKLIKQDMSIKEFNKIASTDIDLVAKLVIEVTKLNIFKNTRKREYIEARSIFYVIMKKEYNCTYAFIEEYMRSNGKSVTHATLVHAVKSFASYAKFNNYLSLGRESILNQITQLKY